MNTRNSALEILDDTRDLADAFSQPISSASSNLYHDLHERIEGALQAKQMIDSELAQPEAHSNADLRAILERNQRENLETLSKFIAQMANFSSVPKGFEEAHQRLQASIRAMHHTPSPTFPESLPANESAAAVAIASSSNQCMTILQVDVIPATASQLPEEAPLHITTTTPDNLHTESETDAVRLSTRREPTPQLSPTSLVQLNPSRMLVLKGLLRRLIQATKRRGRKCFKKNND
ncbi:hypothetical protein BJ165DRAFT_1459146 [Panaeolus papilionaceus]|nr:hypothetical protein BJ165DRAFT_1459146 [Panaeolus papilionaceus]